MHQEHIWNLIAKKLSNEISASELQELERLLRNNPDLHYPIQTITDFWNSIPAKNFDESGAAFERHLKRMKEINSSYDQSNPLQDEMISSTYPFSESGNKNRRKLVGAGILMALIIIGSWILISVRSNAPVNQVKELAYHDNSEISTKNGSKTKVVLPDGTQVWLNAGSKLTYNKQYGSSNREVTLAGEAFFDVVKNKEKPFIIHTGKIEIKVLGTTFNVKSYPGEKTIETSLIKGSIEVTFKDRPSEKVILKPNEKLVVVNEEIVPLVNKTKKPVVTANEPIVAISHLNYAKIDNTIIETAWVQNKLFFQDESFIDLARKMERWYGVTIKFDNSKADTLHFTGSFENETVQQALNALKLTAPFNYQINSNIIFISK